MRLDRRKVTTPTITNTSNIDTISLTWLRGSTHTSLKKLLRAITSTKVQNTMTVARAKRICLPHVFTLICFLSMRIEDIRAMMPTPMVTGWLAYRCSMSCKWCISPLVRTSRWSPRVLSLYMMCSHHDCR